MMKLGRHEELLNIDRYGTVHGLWFIDIMNIQPASRRVMDNEGYDL
jgi:hypothetical protein